MQHGMKIRSPISGVNKMVRADQQIRLQLVEMCDLAVTGRGTSDRFNLAVCVVLELGSKDVIRRNNTRQCRLDDLHGGSGEYEEIEMVSIDTVVENLVKHLDVLFKRNSFSDFE